MDKNERRVRQIISYILFLILAEAVLGVATLAIALLFLEKGRSRW